MSTHADDMDIRCYIVIFKDMVLTVVCRCRHGIIIKSRAKGPISFCTSRMGRTVALTQKIFSKITTTDLPKALKRDSIYNIDILF